MRFRVFFFFVPAESLYINDFGLLSDCGGLCYHVDKGHLFWYFPFRIKKNNLTSAKKLKRGYKNRRTKITERCHLVLCEGWKAIALGIFAKFRR